MTTRWRYAALAAALLVLPQPASAAGPFESWVAVVVAGDDRAHSGAPSEVFDNGRRDIAEALKGIGFLGGRIKQFSVQPDRDPATRPLQSEPDAIAKGLRDLARQASGGCLLYFTSHGSPEGIVAGNAVLTPRDMARMLSESCADRLGIVVVSACYSGVFIPPLQSDNRLILTAARNDRTSFGCGENDRYTFFDECVLETLPSSADFLSLGRNVQSCVAMREMEEGMTPPSEPQLYAGWNAIRVLSLYPFPQSVRAVTGEQPPAVQ